MIKPIIYKDTDFNKLDGQLVKVIKEQFSKGKGLYLYGKAGVGKTHIAWTIADKVESIGIKVDFYKVNKLMFRFRDIHDEDGKDLLERLIGNSWGPSRSYLFLDDLGSNKESEFTLDCLTMILDYRIENLLPTIITSNASLNELLENVGSRIHSRLVGMCKEIEIQGEDRRSKEA